jgi:GNAT superfamily N-acetyltransferase
LRGPHAGDLGWIVERHGALYAREYAWNEEFEALVAKIVADYAQHHDPKREAVWIAEVDGARAGCVMCVQKSPTTAQLRLLLVEPTARGHGLGARLVDECIRFAREHGYKKMVLWTNDVLHSARKIYEAAGFTLAHSAKHHAFGHSLVEQTWELRL